MFELLEFVKEINAETPETIQIAKGKYQYPKTFKSAIRKAKMINDERRRKDN